MSTTQEAPETPIDIPTLKRNNFLSTGAYLVHQLKVAITLAAVFGVNRLYLLKCSRLMLWCSYSISILILTLIVSVATMTWNDSISKSYTTYLVILRVEYTLLVFNCYFLQRTELISFFKNLEKYDEMLNITKDIADRWSLNEASYWTVITVIYGFVECILICVFVSQKPDFVIILNCVTIFSRELEQIFFHSLLKTVLIRLRILKCHVSKYRNEKSTFDEDMEIDDIERLSKNAQLDITSMHRAYELLHKCSKDLSAIMSFPMIVILFSSGFSTIMLVKTIFGLLSIMSLHDSRLLSIITYFVIRCVKTTGMIIIPCYYSSTTTKQVRIIRTKLYYAFKTVASNKSERRKLKAFSQLTRDNMFAYALWGVIGVNMTLPLTYLSLCVTYLVIVIQFSKFID